MKKRNSPLANFNFDNVDNIENKTVETDDEITATQTTIINEKVEVINKVLGDKLNFAGIEAYNLLRTNISFSFPDKDNCKFIGVTSACPQEGKSITSINFAYAMAKSGKKVLLVDSDMRRPTVAKNLGIEITSGLSNALIGEPINVYKDVLVDGLNVLTSGDIPPNPSELIGSEKMKVLLDEFALTYDYVIVDLPPITSVSDALVFSKYLDGFILVIKHGYSRKKDVTEAIRQLQLVNARVLGFIYNGYRQRQGYYKNKYYRNKYYKRHYRYNNYYYNKNKYDDDKELETIEANEKDKAENNIINKIKKFFKKR